MAKMGFVTYPLVMTWVRDYNELDKLRIKDGATAVVLSSLWVYRAVRGHWEFVHRIEPSRHP